MDQGCGKYSGLCLSLAHVLGRTVCILARARADGKPAMAPEHSSLGHPEAVFSDTSPFLEDIVIVFLGAAARAIPMETPICRSAPNMLANSRPHQMLLGQQQPIVADMFHQSPARLDRSLLGARQRPLLDSLRQRQRRPQVLELLREAQRLSRQAPHEVTQREVLPPDLAGGYQFVGQLALDVDRPHPCGLVAELLAHHGIVHCAPEGAFHSWLVGFKGVGDDTGLDAHPDCSADILGVALPGLRQ